MVVASDYDNRNQRNEWHNKLVVADIGVSGPAPTVVQKLGKDEGDMEVVIGVSVSLRC